MFVYIITFPHNIANTVLQSLSVKNFFREGEQCSDLPRLLSSILSSLFTMCAIGFFCSTLNIFPFFSKADAVTFLLSPLQPAPFTERCALDLQTSTLSSSSWCSSSPALQLTPNRSGPAIQGNVAVVYCDACLVPGLCHLESEHAQSLRGETETYPSVRTKHI